ncbi:hypothetical protein NST84_11780 [Paenibacillus sp. FSL R7-0345]|uniref:hypothetical protein n=1 Tax=Paenibacillus sp. FSL R7-0345 TaxID=2954535 RepID=UPI003159F2E5
MSEIKVYFLEDTELAEYEAVNKGFRLDVYVKIADELFNVAVYDIVRLQQDLELEVENYGYYSVDPNLILVSEVNKDKIVHTIENLYKQNYF